MKKINNLLNKQTTYQLRGICMLMIILYHSYLDVIRLNESYFSILPRILLDFGYLGTGIFFFLSGYGMFYSLTRQRISPKTDYYNLKIKKLFYPFIACWIIWLLIDFIINQSIPTYQSLIDLISLAKPYSEAWFYKVIIGTYIVLFSIFRFIRSNTLIIIIIFIICILYIMWSKHVGLGTYWYNSILNLPLGLFFAYKINWIKSLNYKYVIVLCILGVYISSFFSQIFTSIFFTIISTYFIGFISIKFKILSFIGNNCLLFYLFQTPIPLFPFTNSPFILLTVFFLQRTIEKFILIIVYNKFTNKFNLYS